MELTKRRCKPCEGGIPKLNSQEIQEFRNSLKEPWEVADEMKILKEFYV